MTTNLFNNPRPDHEADAQRSRQRRRRPKTLRAGPKPKLTVAQILAWADAHYKRTGKWPRVKSGPIGDGWDTNWSIVDQALRLGLRGLPGRLSLARLLSKRRGVRNPRELAPYTVPQILAWADAHKALTGSWPMEESGPVQAAAGESWIAVATALRTGARGLPGGSSLAKLLAAHRGVRNRHELPRLTAVKILNWADAHFKRTGRWPRQRDGVIPETSGEDWASINAALRVGYRGLPGGVSLAQLLAERRGVRNIQRLPLFTERQILAWADAHHRRTGSWPKSQSGAIVDAPGETWLAVSAALSQGTRGLRGGSSLARLLVRRRGVRNKLALAPFRLSQIVRWARAHRRRAGKLPSSASGPVMESPGDTWNAIHTALHKGGRGLPGGSSLPQLLKARLGASAQDAGLARGNRAR